MSDSLLVALASVVKRFGELISEDEQLRLSLRQLGHTLVRLTETPAREEPLPPQGNKLEADKPIATASAGERGNTVAKAEAEPTNGVVSSSEQGAVSPRETVAPSVSKSPTAQELPSRAELPRLVFRYESAESPPIRQWSEMDLAGPTRTIWQVSDDDLSAIEQRCRLKALAAQWVASPAEAKVSKQELISRAIDLSDCYLWMCQPATLTSEDPALFRQLAGCFEATAASAALVKNALSPSCPPEELKPAMLLFAEAQSALRIAVSKVCNEPDRDQDLAFSWLRAATSERQVFVNRHMRIDDPANPARWPDMMLRIEAMANRLQGFLKRSSQNRKLLSKVKHKVSLIRNNPADQESWDILAKTVDELVQTGLPPSNIEIRELLLPVFDQVPDLEPMPRGFELVLREIARYLDNLPEPDRGSLPPEPPSPAVREVAQLLAGRTMVLIGGVRKPAASEALRESFGLANVEWIETREHQSIAGFEDAVAQPNVAVVVVAIRWSSHSFGGVKEFCDKHGKPFVRLKSGYNPNQVAAAILDQCSRRLRGAS